MSKGRVTIAEMLQAMEHFEKLTSTKRRIFLEHLERSDGPVETLIADLKDAFARVDAEAIAKPR